MNGCGITGKKEHKGKVRNYSKAFLKQEGITNYPDNNKQLVHVCRVCRYDLGLMTQKTRYAYENQKRKKIYCFKERKEVKKWNP